jgi:chemotaxis signal transduction protein
LPQDRLRLHTPLVIVRGRNVPMALLVNAVHAIVRVPAADLTPIPATDTFHGCVESVLTANGQAVHLLSLEGLLLEKERQTLGEVQATETRRLGQAHQNPS